MGKKKDVIDHIHTLSPSIVALVETKVKLSKVKRIASCVRNTWLTCHNFHLSDKGKFCTAWNPDVWICSVHAESVQQMTL